jgi:hypothetical protein
MMFTSAPRHCGTSLKAVSGSLAGIVTGYAKRQYEAIAEGVGEKLDGVLKLLVPGLQKAIS